VARLAGVREELERRNVVVVIVHMGTPEEGRAFMRELPAAAGFEMVSDPKRMLYSAAGLPEGSVGQILGPRVMLRGAIALLTGHRVSKPIGDPRQMAGVLLLHRGEVIHQRITKDIADVPDYQAMLRYLQSIEEPRR
jgi:hypothetical protein